MAFSALQPQRRVTVFFMRCVHIRLLTYLLTYLHVYDMPLV